MDYAPCALCAGWAWCNSCSRDPGLGWNGCFTALLTCGLFPFRTSPVKSVISSVVPAIFQALSVTPLNALLLLLILCQCFDLVVTCACSRCAATTQCSAHASWWPSPLLPGFYVSLPLPTALGGWCAIFSSFSLMSCGVMLEDLWFLCQLESWVPPVSLRVSPVLGEHTHTQSVCLFKIGFLLFYIFWYIPPASEC